VHGSDPESVHQMRVGLRRLRSALDLFATAIECPTFLQEEWKWLAGELGGARDWEVLATSTLETLGSRMPANVDIESLKHAALDQAAANRSRAAQAVQSVRHTRLQLQFAEWMMSKAWRTLAPAGDAPDVNMSLKKFARQVLQHRQQRLNKRSRRLDQNDPETRHRFRIAAKKMRYAMEFFGALYPKSAVRKYLAPLSAMQDELGWLNDAAVAMDLLLQLQAAPQHQPASTAASAAFVRGYL